MIRRGLLATWTIAVLMTALLVVPQPARAGAARWTSEGPYGLSITAMAVDPVDDDVVYAEAANVGIVKSTDAGRTWTPTGFEPYLRVVIAVDAVDHDIVYVTNEQRLWASEDGGATWKVRFRRGLWPSRLAVDPALEGVLYAFDGSQLQQTTDGGFHWSPVVGEPCDSDVCYVGNQVAVDPSEPGTVIASVPNTGVERSRDAGATWRRVLPGPLRWIEWDPIDPAVVYVVTRRDVLRSIDRGANWSRLGIAALHPATIHVDPTNDSILYLTPTRGTGLERSIDGGATWAPFSDGIVGSFPTEVEPTTSVVGPLGSAGALLSATQGGLFRSAHGANRWAPLRRGLPGVPTGVVVAGGRGVLAGTYTPGVFLRSAGRWIPSNSGIPIEYPGRTFRSRDLATLAVAPSDRDVVYAGTFAQGLFRSANGGRSWKSVTRRDLGDMTIAVDPGDPDHLFVASFEGLFESGDGGATLQPRTAGLPPRHDAITSVAFDSGDSTIVYGGGPHGVWLSSDGGGHWHRTTEGLDHRWLDPVAVFADPRHAGVVYVVDSLGVARSTDAGTHWTRLAGSPTDARSLAFDAARPRTLYVGVAKQPGVLISRDGGGTWHFLLGGCGCSSVESLAVAGSGGIRTLYAASSTGVYEVTLPN